MFKELRNEARITFNIHTAGPLLIKGADEPGLDPSLPDMRFVRAYRDGEMVPFIPGSSLKGVLRSRAEQILRTLAPPELEFHDLFGESIKNEMEGKDGRSRYYTSDPLVQLFGQTYLAGRLSCRDAFPVPGRPLHLSERSHVAINRITGATHGGALFNPEVVDEGTFAAEIRITNFATWQMKLVGCLLQDLNDGFLLLGGSTTRGYGRVVLEEVEVIVRDYRADPPQGVLRGYETGEDQVMLENLRFTKHEYYYEIRLGGYDWLVRLPVDLKEEMSKLAEQRRNWEAKTGA